MQGTAIYTDVFFFHSSNPSLTNTTISLNLNVDGIMNVGGPFATSEILLRTDIALASVGELRAKYRHDGSCPLHQLVQWRRWLRRRLLCRPDHLGGRQSWSAWTHP